MSEVIHHFFPPVYRQDSRVLILGTMHSPKSMENGFYYSHPRNRFWPVLAILLETECPQSPEEKKDFLLTHRIALWDVLASCEIRGASDASIKNPVPNRISPLLQKTSVRAIFTSGGKAHSLYEKYCQPETERPAIRLPSTSPANASFSLDDLVAHYRVILDYLN